MTERYTAVRSSDGKREEENNRYNHALKIAESIGDNRNYHQELKDIDKLNNQLHSNIEKLNLENNTDIENVKEFIHAIYGNNHTIINEPLKIKLMKETHFSQLRGNVINTYSEFAMGIKNSIIVVPDNKILLELANDSGNNDFIKLCEKRIKRDEDIAQCELRKQENKRDEIIKVEELNEIGEVDETADGKFPKMDSRDTKINSAHCRCIILFLGVTATILYEFIDGITDSYPKIIIICVGSFITLLFGCFDCYMNIRGKNLPQEDRCRILGWRTGYINLMIPNNTDPGAFIRLKNKICCFCCSKLKCLTTFKCCLKIECCKKCFYI